MENIKDVIDGVRYCLTDGAPCEECPYKHYCEHTKDQSVLLSDVLTSLQSYENLLENLPKKKDPAQYDENTEKLERLCRELVETYRQKNHDYGSSFAEVRKLIPNAVIVHLKEKVDRLYSLYQLDGINWVVDEPVEDTLKDLALYALMEVMERGKHG